MDKMASTKQLYYVCLLDLYMDEFAVFLHEGENPFSFAITPLFFFTANLKENYMCLTFIFKLLHQSSLGSNYSVTLAGGD